MADLTNPDLATLDGGLDNLEQHLENLSLFGIPVVVCINRFSTDSQDELEAIKTKCNSLDIPVSICESWEKGGKGAADLAEKVLQATPSAIRSRTRPGRQ